MKDWKVQALSINLNHKHLCKKISQVLDPKFGLKSGLIIHKNMVWDTYFQMELQECSLTTQQKSF